MALGYALLEEKISDERINEGVQKLRDYGFDVGGVSLLSGIEIGGDPQLYKTVFDYELVLQTLAASEDLPPGQNPPQAYLPREDAKPTIPDDLQGIIKDVLIFNPHNTATPLDRKERNY